MIELIKKIFEYHRFESSEALLFDFGILYSQMKEEGKKYYWLISEQENLEVIITNQNMWFEKCKEKIADSDFDKNTSLLILTKKLGNTDQKSKILKIEENPYQFKKLVLTYTDETLQELLEKTENDTVSRLLKLLVDESTFKSYKQTYDIDSWQNLIYHIAQKLPFLKIDIQINQTLKNLFKKGEENLSKAGFLDFANEIEDKFNDNIISSLESINEDDLLKILYNTSENGN